jgi:hypothetical protein
MRIIRFFVIATMLFEMPSPSQTIFERDRTIEESGSPSESSDQDFYLNSGAYFSIKNGTGCTLQGDLSGENRWRAMYAKGSAEDTNNGKRPQNLFRLMTKKTFSNVTQEAYFMISFYDAANHSEQRAASNGILFMSHGQSKGEKTLYYAGLRVDGTVVIKRKLNGQYTTLAQQHLDQLPRDYDRDRNPNLLPLKKWIGLRSTTQSDDHGVAITVWVDWNANGQWKRIATTTDTDAPIRDKGWAGIRTDFMDVCIAGYRVGE